jgi:hypothetical protein
VHRDGWFFGRVVDVGVEECLDREFAGDLPSGVAAHAVANDEDLAPAGEGFVILWAVKLELIFVVLANATEVGFRGDGDSGPESQFGKGNQLVYGVLGGDVIHSDLN